MKKKKAMLFPYDTSLLHMVIHRDTINEYEIVKVVSLKSWGYCGADAGAKLGVSTGVMVTDDFQSDCCRYQYSVGTQSDKYVHGDNKECRKAVFRY